MIIAQMDIIANEKVSPSAIPPFNPVFSTDATEKNVIK